MEQLIVWLDLFSKVMHGNHEEYERKHFKLGFTEQPNGLMNPTCINGLEGRYI